ncbi:type VI secretion system Vgr family protein [Arvimicrobium flavum]|uniref:type VI secretion system Vgr family protein n=1 Tax=Arvimicrobium flavum TaxID=3393320 RepID=UPI00237AE138|nr:type VI secretion system tip protein TssI/VgrG [Mesorhizobium shangrilense]
MASPYKQDRRYGELHTPLEENELVLRRFDGIEAMSDLFEYRVEAISHKIEPNFDRAIGRNCTVTLKPVGGDPRHFDGILTEVQLIGIEDKDFVYRLILRPWLWMMSKRTNCLIFHDKTAPQIIADIFDANSGFAEYRQVLTEDYPVKEYCVQYRESDMAFVCRLMEENGISYHFLHEKGKHTLVMGDGASAYGDVPGSTRKYVPTEQEHWRDAEHFNVWRPERRFTSGKATLEEYDFKKPTTELRAEKSNASDHGNGELEMFDFPGKYEKQEDGKKLANWWLESEQAADQHFFASGNCVTCPPGYLVTLADHPNTDHNQEYLILRATHSYSAQYYGSTGRLDQEGYHGSHELMSSKRAYAPPIVTPMPHVHGPQTATVVGDGDIDCDEYGRILVRFHWDRAEDQSMRVRVGQVWASQNWGGIFIPRVGMEVIVDHLEGDPDQPIVIGCVYNDNNMPPYDLPSEKNKAGWKSQSTPYGPGYNEIMMDDTTGDELVRLHAQRDLESKIENDERRKVGMNRTTNIGVIDKLDVGMQLNITAGMQISMTVGASTIVMTPASIDITSPVINVTATSALNLTSAMAMNSTAGMSMTSTSGLSMNLTSGLLIQATSGVMTSSMAGVVNELKSPIIKLTGIPIISPV